MKISNNFHQSSALKDFTVEGNQFVKRKSSRTLDYKFSLHYHPYTDDLTETLNRDGLYALMDVNYHASLVLALEGNLYDVGARVDRPFPSHLIDESDSGPCAIYNWELFFHAPLAVAIHLSKNQRFADAQKWFHFIFDPTSTDLSQPVPQRFWKFLRFRKETKPEFLNEMMEALNTGSDPELKERIERSIQAWRDTPFNPHVVARTRYLAYQMNVVMKYIDNLVAWGDSLFRQDTIETLNEATQLYVFASNILGAKPQAIPPRRKASPKSYAQLKALGIDAFGNAMVEMENEFPFNSQGSSEAGDDGSSAVFGIGRALYFCIPQNDVLLAYWDLVADRLYKIRHCMNIEGIVRQLALFDPPIDPGMLVKAAAAGLDIASIVNNINQPLSNIRGPQLLQKAIEICNEVKSLGSALLGAIEKGENEHLAALRQENELRILRLGREVRFLQWKEAEAQTEALLRSRGTTFERFAHYKRLLGASQADIDKLKAVDLHRNAVTEETFDGIYAELVDKYGQEISPEAYRKESSVGGLMEFAGEAVVSVVGGKLGETLPLNKNENAELNIFLPTADTFSLLSTVFNVASAGLGLVPQFDGHATPMGVGLKTGFGGVQLSKFAKYGADGAEMIAKAFQGSADRSAKMATYYRRAEEFVLQANLAASELKQYGRQLITSLVHEQIVKKEYENQIAQIENSEAVQEFMNEKFTQEELYLWMQGELSRVYFDSYKFAFDVAKRAEATMQHELMRPEFDSLNLIKFGYWDGGRRGLLSGETLFLDLKRLEMAYHDQNRREYEVTKHVSISRLDPMALLKLKATGKCEIDVPEWLFDMDSPGQYMRRIKSVALSIPCIVGPYTGVHGKLSLLRSSIRTSSLAEPQYERSTDGDDIRFRDYTGAIQSIVTTNAQNDSGLFETNLRDDRYLPFEGAGVISRWRLELPNDVPQFDFESISDVIFHIRYTAREAGNLRPDASAYLKTEILAGDDGLQQLFTLNHDFGIAWQQFINAPNDGVRTLDLKITKDQLPYWTRTVTMSEAPQAMFCRIDWSQKKLIVASAKLALAGDEVNGWTLSINQGTAPIFGFLKSNMQNRVYMALSYWAD